MSVTDLLLKELNNPSPAARIEMLRLLATLEETQALPAFRAMLKSESDPNVLNVLKWAGNVIFQAQQNGYSTAEGIKKHFRRDLELTEEQKREAEKLAELQRKLDLELMKEKQDALKRQVGTTLALGALGTMMGGASMGASVIMTGAAGMANNPDSGLGVRPTIGAQAIPPQRPTQAEISVWLRRMKDSDAKNRKAALTELCGINNPAALPHIAAVFATDFDPQVKEIAQRSAKVIYYNWVEWEAEQVKQPPKPTSTQEANIADILAKAQSAKEAKKRKTMT